MQPMQVVIYGASGFGREVAWLLHDCINAGELYETVCFVDDNTALHGSNLNGIPIIEPTEALGLSGSKDCRRCWFLTNSPTVDGKGNKPGV